MKNIKTIPVSRWLSMPENMPVTSGMYPDMAAASGFLEKESWSGRKRKNLCTVMQAIAESEAVYLACGKAALPRAKAFADEHNRQFQREISEKKHFPVVVFEVE